jgi:hypothetical protein
MVWQNLSYLTIALALGIAGCNGAVREEVIQVKPSNDPLFEPRNILGRYAAGQPMTSEVTSFPYLVEQVRKTDSARADILEKGLDELQKASPAERPAKAKELLDKLKPSMT